jgi:hypothetical protein
MLLRMRKVLNKTYRDNQSTHFIFSTFFPKIVPFMWKCRNIWCSRRGRTKNCACAVHAGWVRINERQHKPAPVYSTPPPPKHTHTHTHTQTYVILIVFPLQQWFRKRTSMLRYTYIACLVYVLFYVLTTFNILRLRVINRTVLQASVTEHIMILWCEKRTHVLLAYVSKHVYSSLSHI